MTSPRPRLRCSRTAAAEALAGARLIALRFRLSPWRGVVGDALRVLEFELVELQVRDELGLSREGSR